MLMCMCMLNKRTHVLLNHDLWNKLNQLAKSQSSSAGQVIRDAIQEKYESEKMLEQRKVAVENTLRDRPKPFQGRIDYKALINAGRKSY